MAALLKFINESYIELKTKCLLYSFRLLHKRLHYYFANTTVGCDLNPLTLSIEVSQNPSLVCQFTKKLAVLTE